MIGAIIGDIVGSRFEFVEDGIVIRISLFLQADAVLPMIV